jgi:hypothetical protein
MRKSGVLANDLPMQKRVGRWEVSKLGKAVAREMLPVAAWIEGLREGISAHSQRTKSIVSLPIKVAQVSAPLSAA